jgi:heme-degrading monooxygenase HmoA
MYARTSSWTGTPEALKKWAEQMAGSVAPMVAGLPGNAGAYFFIDREDGRALTLTLWESEDAALVSDVTAEKSRESTVAATGVELVDRGRYEVAARV